MGNCGETPKVLSITEGEVLDLVSEIESSNLSINSKERTKDCILALIWMGQKLERKELSIRRLQRLFAVESEKQGNLFKDLFKDPANPKIPSVIENSKLPEAQGDLKVDKKKGHGKTGAAQYPNATSIFYPHESLKKGDRCPECERGKLTQKGPGSILKLVGQAPIVAEVHKPERLRCSSCQQYFTAKVPDYIENGERLDPTAKSMCALLKYGSGMPFYRFSNFQNHLGFALPASTQWDAVEDVADCGFFAFKVMCRFASIHGKIFQNDDTGAKVLMLKKELKEKNFERQGIYTSGILVKTDIAEIAIYMTGNKNAGEHLDIILEAGRDPNHEVALMSDASRSNLPEGTFIRKVNHGKCLDHSRRRFVDAVPAEKGFDQRAIYFIKMIANVYRVDKLTKSLTLEKRLRYHQKYSLRIMEKLRRWSIRMLRRKKIDKKSALGESLDYYLNHYFELTAFTRVLGMPVSNIDLERMLKVSILNKKNSYYYRSSVGSRVGDILMSLIETCRRAKKNPYVYLTELQKNRADVRANSDLWLPWNYDVRLAQIKSGAQPSPTTVKIA